MIMKKPLIQTNQIQLAFDESNQLIAIFLKSIKTAVNNLHKQFHISHSLLIIFYFNNVNTNELYSKKC
jgi:hypothetical protein